jgi:hypothetical protein
MHRKEEEEEDGSLYILYFKNGDDEYRCMENNNVTRS